MCDIVWIRSLDKEIKSVAEFEDFFNINADDYKDEDYVDINRSACFCQLDMDKFFTERPDLQMELEDETYGNWIVNKIY